MPVLPDIRQLYMPVQPAVKPFAGNISYREFLPDTRLQGLIYCYWELKTSQPLDAPFPYRVVTDGCIDVFFEPGAPSNSYVLGFCSQYTEFELEHEFHYIGVRFLPAMFPQLFRVHAAELSNHVEELDAVLPGIARFIADRFQPGLDTEQIRERLDRCFLEQVSQHAAVPDGRFYEALLLILQHSGALQVEKDLDTGISPRQLRRLFEFYVGDTPKTFSKVVRFQNLLRAQPSARSLKESKLFFDAGYYDQAHFIREFKSLYGLTPGQALGG